MHSSELKGDSVLIVGYGREGKSSHRWLLENHRDLRIAIADKNPPTLIEQAPADTKVYSGENYLSYASNYTTLLRSPGIPLFRGDLKALQEQGLHISSLMNLFMEQAPGTLIGLTGTKGKSTSTALLHHILKQSYADVRLVGNIGTPALDSLAGANKDTIFVSELSSFQLEDLRHPPHLAVLLGIVPEHLDHHGSFEEYHQAKLRIIGPDTKLLCNLKTALPTNFPRSQCSWFSEDAPTTGAENVAAYLENNTYLYYCNNSFHPICSIDELQLAAGSNSQNILAALSVASLLGVSPEDARQGLRTFITLPHRLENIGKRHGITFYNDSLSTIPEACIHALDSLGPEVESLIVGGHDRGIAYDKLADEIVRRSGSLKNVMFLPETGRRIEALIRERNAATPEQQRFFPVANLEEAVELAFKHTSVGKICLLSPASSSLNQFRDYQDRGDAFKRFVSLA